MYLVSFIFCSFGISAFINEIKFLSGAEVITIDDDDDDPVSRC